MVQRLQIEYNILIFILIIISLIIFSCEETDNDTDDIIENPFCDSLMVGIKTMDNDYVRPIVNNLVTDLESVPSDSDQLGHKENLYILVDRLNDLCDNMIFSLDCYACIYTGIPQSEIEMLTDSSDTHIRRVIDILTPENDFLSFAGIHP
jgi:hypothetical protein